MKNNTSKKGILLVNLGSPKSTEVKDVRTYLDEFLMDEYVIDYRWIFRAFLVQGIILKTRPPKSAAAYKTVWTEEGSPLIVLAEKLKNKFQKLVDIPVEMGMRYANPSIEEGIKSLIDKGVTDIVLFPLYPQHAMSTTETVMDKAEEVRLKKFPNVNIKYVEPFYDRDFYIDCLAQSLKEKLPKDFDMLQFSYHGVPERHLYKLKPNDTPKTYSTKNIKNYREQCIETTNLVVEKMGLPKEKTIVSFQSRLGKDKWIEPYTDATLKSLPNKGVKKLAICCPAFVADCLETLEEISEEGKETFLHAGGKEFHYLPCLNDEEKWVEVVKTLCEEKLREF
ncbi:ferrochelatase [Riemerella columbipharyngis]|uniref:Ferrochelatase n=1 Tax=Riemerella columbipharyngis TaxID=1071918 RepID=A0A1G7DUD9_9FLAO|nr:ferrochelatase [Riemerella columbipharyngis]SDE54575.1 ferrochelatase [Riemerella columbipharyngis]